MSDWWRAVDDELSRRADEAPDPWASKLTATDARLTDEQVRFLEQLAGHAAPGVDPDDVLADDSASAP